MNISTFLTPAQIQGDIELLGSLLGSLITAPTKALLLQLSQDLLDLAKATFTVAEVDALVKDVGITVPAADLAFFNLVVNVGIGSINLALGVFDSHNTQIVAYVQAVANGLMVVAA